MMDKSEYCFFCCENILEESDQFIKVDAENGSVRIFNRHNDAISTNDFKSIKENVLQISHYLNVPKSIIDQEKWSSSIIKTCSDCTKNSENLSALCTQLEIIKMKIGYYMNQLNSKITRNTTESNGKYYQQNAHLTNFQKAVRKKCALKAQNGKYSRFPELRLTKLPNNLGKLDHQIKSEDISQQAVILEEIEHQLKIETDPIFPQLRINQNITEELHSCPFCTFVVNGPYEELQSHITTYHPEHLQIDQDGPPIAPTCSTQSFKNISKYKGKDSSSSSGYKCIKCGKSFKFLKHLRQHFRKNSICAKHEYNSDYQNSFYGKFECSKCSRLYSRRDFLIYHINNNCKLGTIIDHGSSKELSSPKKSFKQTPKHTFSKCKFCEMFVHSKNLKRHIDNRHPNGITVIPKRKEKVCEQCNLTVGNSKNLKIHMLAFHGVEMPDNLFKCEVCQRSYELKTSYYRHLRKYEKCRLFANREKVVSDQLELGKEIENEVILSIPETGDDDDDAVMIMNDVNFKVEEDPLAI